MPWRYFRAFGESNASCTHTFLLREPEKKDSMSRFLRYVLLFCSVFLAIRAAAADEHYRKFFIQQNAVATAVETIFYCVNYTTLRLFNKGNHIALVCHRCDWFENEIIRKFMKNRVMIVSNQPLQMKKRRAVSYVVFTHGTFTESRRQLLGKRSKNNAYLHRMQYLFVNVATQEAVLAFADDLWRAGFRDIAFLTLNNSDCGMVQMPVMKRTIVLKSLGHCSPVGNDLNRIVPYSSDFYRFCARKPCTMLYGSVTDDTVHFWRDEDKLKMSEIDGYESMGLMLIKRFTSFFGIKAYFRDNLTWPEATRKLLNGELDIVISLMPKNLEIFEGLQVTWIRNRRLTVAAKVRHRRHNHPVLQLLTPFHYSIWICTIIVLLLYVVLLYALRKLTRMSLIRERLEFMQIYEIILGHGVSLPKKTSLRAVLALWMIFSLNLSIVYNSVFTSSLADLHTESLLKDLKELRDSGMPLCGPPIILEVLGESNDPIVIDLYDRYKVMKRAGETYDAIMSNNTVGVVQQVTVDRLNWATRTDRNLRMYTLSQPVFTFSILFYTRVGHPYSELFKRVISDYRESGLIYKWTKYYVINKDKQMTALKKEEDDKDDILSMEHLRPVFEIFFICQTISVLIFFVELFKCYVLKVQYK